MSRPFQSYQFSKLWLPEVKYLLVCLPSPVQIHQAVLIKFLHCKNTILNHSKIDKGWGFLYIYKLDLDQEENILHQMKNKAEKKCNKISRKGQKFLCHFPHLCCICPLDFSVYSIITFLHKQILRWIKAPSLEKILSNRCSIIRSYTTVLLKMQLKSYSLRYTIVLMAAFLLEARGAIYRVLNASEISSMRWW